MPLWSSKQMLARVVIVGAAPGVTQLTYAIPTALEGRIEPGHRVIVPLRSRRLTGVVVETGDDLDSGGVKPKALLEVLEPRPLFDRPHLELMDFLASYYMVTLPEAYQNVIPSVARVESRRLFRIGAEPGPLAAAAMNPIERAILDALAKRPLTLRQLERVGNRKEVEACLNRLLGEGFVERHEGTRGRHRGGPPLTVRVRDSAIVPALRGRKQREIMDLLRENRGGLAMDKIEAAVGNAAAVLRAMARRGMVDLVREEYGSEESESAASATAVAGDGTVSHEYDGLSGAASDAVIGEFEPNDDQKAAINAVLPAVRDRRFEAFLLWGVTASGKTEVYLRIAASAIESGRQVLILVPEIALADQLVRAFRRRFGSLVAIAHSAQNVGERWASWTAALSGQARIMIGPRSAVFAPLHDAGLVVVDEEHDSAYKQGDAIRYNARDLAVALARFSGCPVVLGSATPSAESFFNARRGRYRLLRLPRRAGERAFAEVEIIDLRQHLKAADRSAPPKDGERASDAVPLSAPLLDALRRNLVSGGQSVVFLNRRGYHNFLQCHVCGNVIACDNCSVSMTFHLRDHSLRCHYCGARESAPEQCPACSGFGLEGQGYGTERLVHSLQTALPDARIARMDSDTSGRRGARSAIVNALSRGEIDILVGTQMITKGFDFPGVTLVGVVLADLALNIPDFRSAERTFQLLTQVAGRAGRGDRPGRVLIQTYAPNHYSIRAARDQDYARFIRRELQLRREMMYPPFARMALVRIEGADASEVADCARRTADFLTRTAKLETMRVLGPAPAPIERIKQRYRWQVVLKTQALSEMRNALAALRAEVAPLVARAGVHLAIDIDPVNML